MVDLASNVCNEVAAQHGLSSVMVGAAEREQVIVWLLQSATEFCRCDRTVHMAVAIFDLHTAAR